MRTLLPNRERSERDAPRRTGPNADASEDERSVAETTLFRLGRVVFGGLLAFMAIDNLRNLEERTQYAESKGAPAPETTVPGITVGLLAGSIGVALWRLPAAAAAAVASFFATVTPVMHDFWNLEDPEQKQQELLHFLKNTVIFGAALAFLKLGRRE